MAAPQQLTPFETLRSETLDYFHATFKALLVSPTKVPFHELKFFDQVSSIRRHLMAFPRGVIKTALEDPIVYLEVPSITV